MTDLTIGRDTFRITIEGEANRPALMLSNALGTDLTMWDAQMPALTQHFRVIRYDMRGHGGSSHANEPISIADLGRDALAILDALEIDKTHWLGLSMGGAVGLWLLAHAPERIERAVLANTAARLGTPEAWNARITSVLAGGMKETAAATIERWFSAEFTAREPKQIEAIHALLLKTAAEGYAACCAALRDMDLREALRTVEHDVLVISGQDDPVVPADEAAAFVGSIPGVRHVALAARHLSSVEAAADFGMAVIDFLTAKPATRTKSTPRKAAPRKATPAKVPPAKRGSATRRSNAARNPLKKTPAKRTAAKKTRIAAVRKKTAAPRRRPAAKKTATRSGPAPKAVTKAPAKAVRKKTAAPTRRATPATARGSVKTVAKKTKPTKTAAKTTKKAVAKTPAKKLPAARRKPPAKPRRPTGRRKP